MPTEIRTRWSDKAEEALDAQSNQIRVDVTAIVVVDANPGDIIWIAPDPSYSALEQWYGTGSGVGATQILHQVVIFDNEWDLKGRVVRKMLKLIRWRSDLPEQES